jgi:hypothetical protein
VISPAVHTTSSAPFGCISPVSHGFVERVHRDQNVPRHRRFAWRSPYAMYQSIDGT